MFTLRVQAETYAAAYENTVAQMSMPVVPKGVDPNDLPKEDQRALMKAQMSQARGRR